MHYNFGWYSINPCTLYLFCSSDKTQEDSSVSDQFGDQYFKDFDFLDNETEHIDDEVEDQFNWGVKRQHSMNEVDIDEVTKQDIMQRINMRKAERGNTQETESSAKSTDDEAADEPEVNGLTEARSCDYIFCFSQTQNRLELVASTFKLLIAGATNFS